MRKGKSMVASLLALTMMFSTVGCTPTDGGSGGGDSGSQSQGTCTVTVNNANPDGGYVTGSGSYTNGESVLVTATPKAGYNFVGWYDGTDTQVSNNAMYSFTVSADKTLTAKFELNSANTKYTITVQNSDATKGSVSDGGEYTNGKSVTVTAIAKDGYKFVRWTDTSSAEVSTDATYTFTVSGDATLVAVWAALETYTITTTTSDATAGTITGAGECNEGALVTLLARPNAGYAFVGWKVGEETVSTDLLYQFKATADKTVEAVWRKIQFNVSVTNMDEEAGAIAGAGTYGENASVTLTATPNNDYVFVGWKKANGDLISPAATYTFTATEDLTIFAHWQAKTKYAVTLTSDNDAAGEIAGAGVYNDGDTVTVTATPNTGYAFLGWFDGETSVSTNATHTFTAEANKTLQAKWEQTSFAITVTNRNASAGAVVGAGTYDKNATVTLTATPNAGYTFAGWQVGTEIVSTDLTYEFSATANVTVSATWNENTYTVTATSNIAAAGTITGAASDLKYGDTVELKATTTNAGYTFDGWYVGTEKKSSDTTYSFDVTADVEVEARWTAIGYTITVNKNVEEAGSFTGGGSYAYGASVTLTATTNVGYAFNGWFDGETQLEASPTYTFTASADRTITAKWTKFTYNISVGKNIAAAGTVEGANTYEHGDQVTLTATTKSGYVFVGWYVGTQQVSTNATYTFTADSNKDVQARWTLEGGGQLTEYEITVNNDMPTAGSVSGGGTIAENETVTLTATPNAGHTFLGWYENGSPVSTDTTYSFTASANRTLTAKWTVNNYTITATSEDDNKGTVTGADEYDHGEQVTLTATAKTGYTFEGWYENGTKVAGAGATYTFTAIANRTLTAKWTKNTYVVIVTKNMDGGTVTGEGSIEHGENVTLEATTKEGFTFDGWYVGEQQVSNNETYVFAVTETVTVTAKWTRNTATVTFVNDNEDAGYAEAYPDGEVAINNSVKLEAYANEGYEFAGWYDGETLISTDTEYEYKVAGTVTITAKWNKTRFTVSVVNDNATAGSVVGGKNYNKNESATLYAEANRGYVFDGWYVGTEKKSSETTYTFVVTADVEVTAKWIAQVPVTVTVESDNAEAGAITGGGSFITGTKAILTATANTGYAFDGWYDGETLISTDTEYGYIVTGEVTITAKWTKTSFTVSVSNDTTKGSVAGAKTYNKDENATLKATAKKGYRFAGWFVGGDKKSDSETYTFKVTADVTVEARWEEIVTYDITVTLSDSAAGSVIGAGLYEQNANVTLTAAANSGYRFVGWYEGETQLSTNATYTFTASAKRTILAKYEVVQSGGGGGEEGGEEGGGSGSGSATNPEGDILLDPNTTVTLTAVVGESATEKNIVEAAAEGFKALYPNVTVTVRMASDIPYQAQSGADIVTCIGENVAEYVKKGALAPLDEYMLMSDFDTNAYYSSMLAMGTSPVDGNQYMMPRAYARIVCFYNKTIFDQCSVDYPENDWTWDDYLATCEQFKLAGRSAVQITQAPMDWNILNWAVVSSFGVTNIMNSDWTVIGTDNAQYNGWKQGMELAAQLGTKGYAVPSKTYNPNAFTQGMAAMAFMSTDAMADIVATGIDFDVVCFPAIGSTPKVATGAIGYGIAPNSQNKDAAWAFLQYMMSSNGQATVSRIGKGIPVLKSLAEDETAEWRSSSSVAISNMLSYPERDVTASWFGALPADARAAYGNLYNAFMSNIIGNNFAFERAYSSFVADIASTKDELGI